MAITKWVDIQLSGSIFGEEFKPNLRYFSEATFSENGSGALADLFVSQCWGAVKPLISNRFRLDSVTVIQGTIGSLIYHTTTRYVDEVGDEEVSESLPSFVSVKMIKIPDNENAVGIPPGTPFRNGLFGWPGLPEASVDGNLLTDAAYDDWQTAWEAFEELNPTIGGSPRLFKLGMQRFESGGVPVSTPMYTMCLEVECRQAVGSNNTRKFSL